MRPPVLWSAVLRALPLVVAVAVAGCAHRPPEGPQATLRAFAAAVQAGRVDDAYALMSADYRRTHDRDAFARSLGPDAKRAAAQLSGRALELHAEVELADGERLELVDEPDGWRFARDPLDLYPQRTPDEALRSFMRAVERKRWDVALRFVPQRYRGTITADSLKARWEGDHAAELKQQLDAVRAHLDEPMELAGDEARLPVGERKQARLIREDGRWKIETLE